MAIDFIHKSLRKRTATPESREDIEKYYREAAEVAQAHDMALEKMREEGLMSRRKVELAHEKELAKPGLAKLQAEIDQTKLATEIGRAEAIKKGILKEPQWGISGSSGMSRTWGKGGRATAINEETGKVYEVTGPGYEDRSSFPEHTVLPSTAGSYENESTLLPGIKDDILSRRKRVLGTPDTATTEIAEDPRWSGVLPSGTIPTRAKRTKPTAAAVAPKSLPIPPEFLALFPDVFKRFQTEYLSNYGGLATP